jgi:competence transcription factor ComK
MVVKLKYVKRATQGIQVKDYLSEIENSSLKYFLNRLCLMNGSTYDGRIQSSKFLLHTKGLVPFYVSNEIVFFSSKNIREFDVVFINTIRVLKIVSVANGQVKIVFDDLDELLLNVSFNKLNRQYMLSKEILKLLL